MRDTLVVGRLFFILLFRSSELSSPSGVVPFLAWRKEESMPFQAILDEVEQLHGVSSRIEGLAENHPVVGEELLVIAGNVRSTATILAILVATKMGHKPI